MVSFQLEGADTGDFEAANAAAFLLSTESSKTIFIAVKDDDRPEADETFTFNLTLQVNGASFGPRGVRSSFMCTPNFILPLMSPPLLYKRSVYKVSLF